MPRIDEAGVEDVIQREKGEREARLHHLTEHLANERTHLAYLRTSISLITLGIAINRLALYLLQAPQDAAHRPPEWLWGAERVGFAMVIVGMLLMVFAAVRYSHIARAIEEERFYPPNRIAIWAITFVVLIIGWLSLYWMF